MDVDGHRSPRNYNSFDHIVAGRVSAGTGAVLQLKSAAAGRSWDASACGGVMSERERIRLTSMVACAG
jgi:hypothetical protein